MNVITSSKLQEGLKRNRRLLFVGVLLLIVTIGLGVWAFTIHNQKLEAITMNSAILDEKLDVLAEIEVASGPVAFAEYDDTTDKYYFVGENRDEDKLLYIVYLSADEYRKLNKNDHQANPITIRGMTRTIPEDVKKLAIEAYNEIMNEEFLNQENFEDYLGAIYLDATKQAKDTTVIIIIAILTGIFAFVSLITGFSGRKSTKKLLNSFTNEEWKKIEQELESDSTISYNSLRLHFTEHYIINANASIDIFAYDDIVWMYPFLLKQYGITTSKSIILNTKDKKKHEISNVNNFSKKSKEQYEDIMSFIHDKNPSIVVGYTKENIKQMKDLYGIKR